MDGVVREQLVAHRGFHCRANCIGRPLENTLQSMETAWAHGVLMCECDITSTSDNHIVLCHDNTIARLALNPASKYSSHGLDTLKFSEIASNPLKNGVRLPLLDEVLLAASRIGPQAQLVVEIKHGVPTIGKQLAHVFFSQPHVLPLLNQVCVVMSFDPRPLHDFLSAYHSFITHSNNSNNENKIDIKKPKVMVLTRTKGRPLKSFESWLCLESDWIQPTQAQTNSGNGNGNEKNATFVFEKQNTVLENVSEDGSKTVLDGVYAQFDPLMVGEERERFAALCKQMTIGIWDAPDTQASMADLIQLGASFVNSDLPNDFLPLV